MRGKRIASLTTLATLLVGMILPTSSAAGEPQRDPLAPTGGPPLHLIAADDHVVIKRSDEYNTPFPIGMYIGSPDGDFQLRATRADYLSPMMLEQWIDGGTTKVALDPALLQGFSALKDFAHVTVTNHNDKVVGETTTNFCPSAWNRQRINDNGPVVPAYPTTGCWENPFMLGNVMGLEEGWAVALNDEWMYGAPFTLKDGEYTVHVEISPTYVDLFSMPPTADDATVHIKIRTVKCLKNDYYCGYYGPRAPAAAPQPTPLVPDTTTPDPSTVPDLISLPAFGIYLNSKGANGKREFVSFGANVWNRGPAPLFIEGYREPGEARMDAFQYFTDAAGTPVARAEVGELEYDRRDGHDHWHLRQFARYDLLDADKAQLVRSRKEAFCLFPTDAIDLTVDRADWTGSQGGLSTACGGADALWVREVLQTGWGDTYHQGIPGQAFNISGLPNGKYFIRVTANPTGELYETDDTNNSSLRRIIIRGAPGKRYVSVPPWNGIDTG